MLGTGAALLVLLATFAGVFPEVMGLLVAIVAGWLGLIASVRAFIQARDARREEKKLEQMYERLDGHAPEGGE